MPVFFCNNCFRQRTAEPSLQLNISSCGHVLCADCLQPKCPKCERPYRAIKVDQNLPLPMRRLFEDPLKQHEQFLKTVKFQYTQEAILNDYFVNQMPLETAKIRRESKALSKMQAHLEQGIEKEKKRMEKLQKYLDYHERRQELPGGINLALPRRVRTQRNSVDGEDDTASTSSVVSGSQRRFQPQTPTLSSGVSSGTGSGSDRQNKTLSFNL